jgi:PKHD-type hydroxylase
MLLSTSANPAPNDGVVGVGFADNLFSREECQRIVELSLRLEPSQGTLGAGQNLSTTKRNSDVVRLIPDAATKWIYERMDAAVGSANRGYQFDLSGFEILQVASYTNGGHYDWHMDIGKGPTSTRKLGISLQLSESNDYEGGDLEFRGGGAPPVAPRTIGTMIVFPSFMQHRITPVTRGVRWSLVAWVHGAPFR